MALRIYEIVAKSIITPTKVPSADFVINPYTGCQFACVYCFASSMGRFVGEPNDNWGNYVYVKTNAVELAEKAVPRRIRKTPHARIAMSTITDPYQPVERKYRLTRGILGIFAQHDYQGRVSILTKSTHVLDDLEVLKQLHNAEVGLTITTSDDAVSRQMEVMAPLTYARLEALRKLNAAGIKTYVFIGPLLPHMFLQTKILDTLLCQIRNTGTQEVKVEYLNIPGHVRSRIKHFLKNQPDEVHAIYAQSQEKQYRENLDPIIRDALKRHDLKLRFGEIVHHLGQQNLKEIDLKASP